MALATYNCISEHYMQDLNEDLRNTQVRRQERRHGAMSYADGLRMMQGVMSEQWPADVEDTLRAHGIPLLERQARNWVDVGNGQVFPVETIRPWSEVTSLIFAYACCHYLEACGFTLTHAIAFPVQRCIGWLIIFTQGVSYDQCTVHAQLSHSAPSPPHPSSPLPLALFPLDACTGPAIVLGVSKTGHSKRL